MTRFLFRRLLLLLVILLTAHAGGFVYAVLAGRRIQLENRVDSACPCPQFAPDGADCPRHRRTAFR